MFAVLDLCDLNLRRCLKRRGETIRRGRALSLVPPTQVDPRKDRNSANDVELCGLDFTYLTLELTHLQIQNMLSYINTRTCLI